MFKNYIASIELVGVWYVPKLNPFIWYSGLLRLFHLATHPIKSVNEALYFAKFGECKREEVVLPHQAELCCPCIAELTADHWL